MLSPWYDGMTATVQTSCQFSISYPQGKPKTQRGLQTTPLGDKPTPCNDVSHIGAEESNGSLHPVTDYSMNMLLTIVFLDKFQCMHWVNAYLNDLYQ